MKEIINEIQWRNFLRDYGARNQNRPTRLGVFETRDGVANDYWIEDGLPLVALDVYGDHEKTRIDILFPNYTHSIYDVTALVRIGGGRTDGGLDIHDGQGKTTLLRFENWTFRSEDK